MANGVKKIGVVPATLMVAGNMMGSGVFMLPATLAATGGIAIFGWVVTTAGAVALALVYAKMASIDDSPGGSYAYARRAFGDFMGYQTNTLYWLASWIGNVAIAVVGIGYLAYFFPFLRDPVPAALAAIGVLWLFTFFNMLGPDIVTKIQSSAVSLALVPTVGVAIFGWFWFSGSTYMDGWNVSGLSPLSAVGGTLNATLWAFIGVETASVAAGVVENPKRNVPIATVAGVLIAAVVYILGSTAVMGMIPNGALQKSTAPYGDAVALALGPIGGSIVAFCAMAGCLGSLAGWTLVVGQSAKAAADDGLFPEVFGRVNAKGVPATGLAIVAAMMTAILLLTISPNASKQFGVVSSISVIMTLIPYIYTGAALRYLGAPYFGRNEIFWRVTILLAIFYSSWAIVGSDPKQVLWTFVVVLILTATYARTMAGGTAPVAAASAVPEGTRA
jgi:arginine:agmatine antiporter